MLVSKTHFCDCPKPGSGFLMPYVVVFFMFNGFRWEVVVRFADIGEIMILSDLSLHWLAIKKISKKKCRV
jgi:hypothetical protein